MQVHGVVSRRRESQQAICRSGPFEPSVCGHGGNCESHSPLEFCLQRWNVVRLGGCSAREGQRRVGDYQIPDYQYDTNVACAPDRSMTPLQQPNAMTCSCMQIAGKEGQNGSSMAASFLFTP